MHIPCPGRGIPRPPIDQVELWVVVACAPGRYPASFPGLSRPGVVAGLARSWDGIRLPGLLARLRIIGRNEAADTQFTPRGPPHDLALGYQWRKRQVVSLLVVFNGRIPDHFARFGIQG